MQLKVLITFVAVFGGTIILVIGSNALVANDQTSVEEIEIEEWDISNTPYQTEDILLDGYGNQDKTETYVHFETNKSTRVSDYGLEKINDKLVFKIEASHNTNVGENEHTYITSKDTEKIEKIVLELNGENHSTETCGCVFGDYS